jgi:hypothetical protein
MLASTNAAPRLCASSARTPVPHRRPSSRSPTLSRPVDAKAATIGRERVQRILRALRPSCRRQGRRAPGLMLGLARRPTPPSPRRSRACAPAATPGPRSALAPASPAKLHSNDGAHRPGSLSPALTMEVPLPLLSQTVRTGSDPSISPGHPARL